MRSVLVTYFDNAMLMRPDYVTALQPKCVRMLSVRNALFEGYRCQEGFDNTAAGYICCGILCLLSPTLLEVYTFNAGFRRYVPHTRQDQL
jgi:hypothetical protein